MTDAQVAFDRLLTIMNELREQCPWDRKQTIESLRLLTIEETYELADAIDEKDMKLLKEEIGDVLLHMIFYSKIAAEQNAFDITDVINTLCDKLIRRHPHIYGDPDNEGKLTKVNSEADVKHNWEQIKMKERKKSVLEGVPKSLPAVVKAFRIQDKAKQVGFEWENKQDVWKKVEEELDEFRHYSNREQLLPEEKERMEQEFGDVMFSLINFSRFLEIDPEAALEKTNKKFISRFRMMEDLALEQKRALKEMSLEEMDALWNKAKEVYP
ncbi:MAG TPA: nucleoside triphosphate pyrophosphohydrolase [Chitinophagales bacterium]|nr:nucleoside triphosphate pyrophosphohydrolase [Chitinophagales bacterium]